MPLAPGSAPDLAPTPNQGATSHWVIPFAASLSEPCQHALTRLKDPTALPRLSQLLDRLPPMARLEGDEYALAMPHERLLAHELGWQEPGGLQPWGAWWAARDGLTLPADRCWALLSPGHWLMGREHLTLLDPSALGLDEATSKALLEALRPLFEDEGWQLRWGAPTRWYASHPLLDGLATASLERVVGRNPDLWLGADAGQATATRALRRLQAEVQMSLYQHPLNDQREAQGLQTVNSFWVSGCGRQPGAGLAHGALPTWPEGLTVCDDLRAGLLSDDMPVWVDAWQHLDATVLAGIVQRLDAGQPCRLTLCGERHAVTLGTATARSGGFMGAIQRSIQALRPRRAAPLPSAILAPL